MADRQMSVSKFQELFDYSQEFKLNIIQLVNSSAWHAVGLESVHPEVQSDQSVIQFKVQPSASVV